MIKAHGEEGGGGGGAHSLQGSHCGLRLMGTRLMGTRLICKAHMLQGPQAARLTLWPEAHGYKAHMQGSHARLTCKAHTVAKTTRGPVNSTVGWPTVIIQTCKI